MNILDKTRLLQTSILTGLIMGLGGVAYAQVEQVPAEEDEVFVDGEEIVVTGSRIKRRIGDAPVPLQIIEQEKANISGFNNLSDFLSDIPALQGSQVPDDTTGAVLNAAGLSVLNLRNLGTTRTLTLIDGQRQVASVSGTAAVDTGTIPFIAIERTEVLTGGASSIYGADAVSGVVNFITRKNFDGVRVDGQFAEDKDGFNESYRLSGLMGSNFDDDKGNAMIALEYRQSAELLNSQVDFLERSNAFLRIDRDVDEDGDGIQDADGQPNFGLFQGGTLDIINDAGVLQLFTPTAVNPTGTQITFDQNGNAIPFNRGRDPRTGALIGTSNSLLGGDGTTFNGLSRSLTPANKTVNMLARFNYEFNKDLNTFIEGRYSHSNSESTFQPSFFGSSPGAICTQDPTTRELSPCRFGRVPFTGTDNAFLDPAAAAAINGAFNLADVQRFQAEFNRSQEATRELFRVVGGAEGAFNSPFAEENEWDWNVTANFGRTIATNRQKGVRLNDNFFAGADAIRISQQDLATLNEAGNPNAFEGGEIVCRVQFLQAAGLVAEIPGIGAVSQQTIDNCVPFSIFGEGAISDEAIDYVSAQLNDQFEQEQLVLSASLSGDLVDLWGAGETLFAIGAEYREERSETAPDELALNENTFANIIEPTVGEFDVYEIYGELSVPLLKDMAFAESMSLNLAGRYSDYSSFGGTYTYGGSVDWVPTDSLKLRGGYARAVRVPNIGELFAAPSQTFVQIADPCDSRNINDGPIAGARERNCAALGLTLPFEDLQPNASNSAFNSGNLLLNEEVSDTIFAGFTYTPSFIDGFIMDVNYFDISIDDAVVFQSAQQLVNNCYDAADGPNLAFCNLFDRNNDINEVANIIVGPVNFAQVGTEGVDFAMAYRQDLADIYKGFSSVPGAFNLSLAGTYVINNTAQSDPNDESTFDDNAGEVGLPELRFNADASYIVNGFTFTYGLNWQSSQDRFQDSLDPVADLEPFLKTGSFAQHDFSVRYEVSERLSLRGGIVNAFDNEPPGFAENNIFDFFGRRFFLGATANF